MKNEICYRVHLPTIEWPEQTFVVSSTSQSASIDSTALLPTETDSLSNYLTQAHRQFLHYQKQLLQQWLQSQQQIWQCSLQALQNSSPDNFSKNIAAASEFIPATKLPGPKFSRQDLEQLASGKISDLFGEWFAPLDNYERLIRMPEPPLLLADRVTGIAGEAGSQSKGTIWTETDVTENSWYLHHNRMPAGIMIESGQADLLLASWLGFDFNNRGKRVYRLLGCELSYHGELPKPGETLCYDIHIDGQAKQGDIRLFFFHYDCHINGQLRLRVRHGQAGFFTDEELAASGGVLWEPANEKLDNSLPFDKPKQLSKHKKFSKQQINYFAAGDLYNCFGEGFEWTRTHTRTPRISADKMLFIDEITDFDINGGPWQRGYMRAIQNLHADDWFFRGHFKNDPCMPGTLMLEAGLQVLTCYLTALGFSIDKDGWRFEPVIEQVYKMQCRGQAIPTSKQIVYEIFVNSIIAAPHPTIIADLLATVDGLKAFHTKIGLRLIPDWPLSKTHPLLKNYSENKPVATVNGFRFDYASLLACAWGKPSTAFGDLYKPFDNHRRVPRLPGPPYHFMTRINRVEGDIGGFKIGSNLECEYDIPKDAWYFNANGFASMPFCVLMETALQPCGWLASYLGSTLRKNEDLLFRNLDGTGTLLAEILPTTEVIRTQVQCTNIFESGSMIIESFNVACFAGDRCIYKMDTTFGFFPPSAFENQTGLPIPETEKTALTDKSNFHLDLLQQPEKYFSTHCKLPDAKLLMIDTITGFWPEQGQFGLGRIRAEKNISADEWFFKAHFFQDPVQPGSLGVEAMLQLLQFYMLQQNMQHSLSEPHFQSLALDTPITWKYRGQVVPTNQKVNLIMDIVETGFDPQGAYAIAKSSLWVDGKRIYEASNIGMRIANNKQPLCFTKKFEFHPEQQSWVKDHCPTYLIPTLPMMSMLQYIKEAAQEFFPNHKIIAIEEIRALRWLVADKPILIYVKAEIRQKNMIEITLTDTDDVNVKPFAKGIVRIANTFSAAPINNLSSLTATKKINPYDNLFHGKSMQVVKSLLMSKQGSTSTIAMLKDKTIGADHIFMDAITHGIPHDNLSFWDEQIPTDQIGYPALIPYCNFYSEKPATTTIQCETRFAGFYLNNKQLPLFDISLLADNKVWIKLQLVDALFPKGTLGMTSPDNRRKFLQLKQFVPDLALSTFIENTTQLHINTVKNMDWLPGSIAKLYQVDNSDLLNMTEQIAIKEHFARKLQKHPAEIKTENLNYRVTREKDLIIIS